MYALTSLPSAVALGLLSNSTKFAKTIQVTGAMNVYIVTQ
jgi:hypothetical protein